MVDENHNDVSDVWEKTYNNDQLFTTYDPVADPDGDGWTNAQEAIAGTDPFHANPPNEYPLPDITHVPAVYGTDENGAPVLQTPDGFLIHWNAEIGKQYTLLGSADLSPGSWFPVDDPITALNPEIQIGLTPTQPGGGLYPALFFRAAVNDVDSDGDGFTDYEEGLLHTDPAVADSDADGLPDAWEIHYGLDPHDNGTGDPNNGPDGDLDGDGFTNLQELLGASSPSDPTNTPIGAGTGVPTTHGVGGPPNLLSETVSTFGYKHGFSGFTDFQNDPDAHLRYLNRVSVSSSTETDNDGDGGTSTTTEVTDPENGDITSTTTRTGGTVNSYGGTWQTNSDTSKTRNGTDNDGSGETSEESETLSNENTTDQMISRAEAAYPPYTGNFERYGQIAEIYLGGLPYPTAYSYSCSKMKYKWESHKRTRSVPEIVDWLEYFMPSDDGTPSFEAKTWTNQANVAESPVYEIKPHEKNAGRNGIYGVVPVDFHLLNFFEFDQGWDPTRSIDIASVGVGKTNSRIVVEFSGISPEAAAKLELVVAPGSTGYISLSDNTITGDSVNFDINGLKATPANPARIILKTKGKNDVIASLDVLVFEKVEMNVAVYTVFDGRAIHENTKFNREFSDNDIINKLNAVYTPQANIEFKIVHSGPVDMGSNANNPEVFNEAGEFDWTNHRADVIAAANIPAHTLPILIVRQTTNLGLLGATNNEKTDCFINNIASGDLISAHEAGHFLVLSTEEKGQANMHDDGPWPQELIDAWGETATGLMYDYAGTNWLRSQDWKKANEVAKQKSK
jgi:hypothetical protein